MLHVPLPANVIGLILFTGSLYTGLINLEWVESAAQFLTKHMMLCSFYPLSCGHYDLFSFT
ncbi:CidA/LrgA family protein [Paenibacillus larvae]|nr:CidA/LrgA family protein [Paenibacillus larvae]